MPVTAAVTVMFIAASSKSSIRRCESQAEDPQPSLRSLGPEGWLRDGSFFVSTETTGSPTLR